ncbi:MAG: thioredoxin fold domain-containing protein [Rubrivivax sp.]|nr:thioredoxin fold domain-containing protein [Rubrivivax sp.]
MNRRLALCAAGGSVLALLAACSKGVDNATAPGAAAPPSSADTARLAFEAAAQGTGFVVGQAMAAREVRVFFDPQCPHCATLWAASRPLHDRIRMVWMPVAFIGPTSGPQGALLLASADAAGAMDQHESLLAAGKGGLAVPGPADDGLLAKIKANTEIWRALKAESVPYMVYRVAATGPYGVQPGGLPTEQLAQMLQL